MKLEGWGRFPRHECHVTAPRTQDELIAHVAQGNLIARGNGRAYGDSAANRTNTVDMRGFNHMLAFSDATGQLVLEAGVLLEDVIATFLPRGWFPPVTPGTKFVTIGGMVAADVHGKNHHKHGSFGSFIDWVEVLTAEGNIERCSKTQNAGLFEWTVGGMGLTGIILRVAFRLLPVQTGWIRQTSVTAPNLEAVMDIFERSSDATYSVAWIDCLSTGSALGRSLVLLGEHATLSELPRQQRLMPNANKVARKINVPIDAPSMAMNRVTMRLFNALYYWHGSRQSGSQYVGWDPFFYPLDAIGGWNKIYGRKGLAQFQCVLPLSTAKVGLRALLQEIAESGQGAFLSVLKRFGEQDSRFSFPMEGYTLALDFPMNPQTLLLMERLDQITLEHNGRFYLAKDSRMTADTLRQSDDRVKDFVDMRSKSKAHESFQSIQAERLKI
ncbi:MAG: FAD-binding oxidoreductase [Parvibaculaceae bacterium]|nr:FAD-binding oxidoreductase [Parvibaculaceae bacterium]